MSSRFFTTQDAKQHNLDTNPSVRSVASVVKNFNSRRSVTKVNRVVNVQTPASLRGNAGAASLLAPNADKQKKLLVKLEGIKSD